jgi:hexosaminidase
MRFDTPARQHFYIFSLLVVLFLILSSCGSNTETVEKKSISVHWELVTNFTDEVNVFNARFELKNNSQLTLSKNNWALFFNMAPRQIVTPKKPQPASLHHINGDWYKLVPNENFSLKPNETVVVDYQGVEGVIKETDRPLGLYFVFYDQKGKEEEIIEVADYTWTPFTKSDQINRNTDDAEPIPTADWSYKNNLDMKPVAHSALPAIVPSPVKYRLSEDSLTVTNDLEIYYQYELEKEAQYLVAFLKDLTGRDFKMVTTPSSKKLITLWLDKIGVQGASKEAYSLSINDDGIMIKGSDRAGVFYAIQSLRALVPITSYQKKLSSIRFPFVVILDAPRFAFRGLHLDVSRNFQTKETILRLLDLLSFYKINRFLFYTTEDEGWRVEIKDLPELTTVGAQRQHTTGKETAVLHPAYGSGPYPKAEGKFGHGHYTRADFIEILKYANDRHIKVIPELNFPGHARAAIKAMESRYERLMQEGREAEANEYRLIDPNDQSVYLSAQGYKDNVVCVARESVFRFYEKVVDEIADMYKEAGLKLDEFHTGGDEVPEGAWTKSPLAMELLKRNPEIKDPKNLQAYFFRELVKRLKTRNIRAHGWEEVALMKTQSGEYVPNPEFAKEKVVPYIWNNMFDYPDLGYRLANAGYDVVLCNVSNFYFDLAYSKDPLEPGLYWAGFVDTRHAWTFAAYDMFKTTNKNSMGQALDFETGTKMAGGKSRVIVEHLKAGSRNNILGIEAQLWSETIKGRDMLEYYMLPKLIGFAESAWGKERVWESIENKIERDQKIRDEWNVFGNMLAKKELPRLGYINGGYDYRLPPPGAVIEDGHLRANVEYPGLIIRYTTDGSEPTTESPAYENPVAVSGKIMLKSFDISGKSSRSIQISGSE